jgi:flagella basal body P-ring formation protein FlgA
VINPVRPRLAVSAGLLALFCALAQAQGQPTADPALDVTMAERVRGLVGSNVTLPALKGATARVEIEIGKLDPRLRLAPCRRIEPQLPPNGALWGRTRIGLRCVEGERAWQVWLPVVVKVFAPALVPVRALPAGTVLVAEHLQPAEVDWAEQAAAPFTQASALLGRSLAHAMQPGQAVRAGDLRLRQWFAAGDTVRVRARGDGFSVSGEGQAMGAGIEGQSVRVRTESGRVLTGLPVAAHQVEVVL